MSQFGFTGTNLFLFMTLPWKHKLHSPLYVRTKKYKFSSQSAYSVI